MSLFRSEEHIDRWLRTTGRARGALLSVPDTWRLAKAWYKDPREVEWRPRTRDESQSVLTSLGLTDEFWTLP